LPDLPDGGQPVRSRNMQDSQVIAEEIVSARATITPILAIMVIFWLVVLCVQLDAIAATAMAHHSRTERVS
jgi:hypothetical protein